MLDEHCGPRQLATHEMYTMCDVQFATLTLAATLRSDINAHYDPARAESGEIVELFKATRGSISRLSPKLRRLKPTMTYELR